MEGETSAKIERLEIEAVSSEEITEELIPEAKDEVTEVDVSYEEIDYENDPLVQLFQSFHVCPESINIFLGNIKK